MSQPIPETNDPFSLFETWLEAARGTEINDPNAMALATATPGAAPSVRMVLLKSVDPAGDPAGVGGRGFVFFTNRESRKGHELDANPQAALLFHWKTLRRQVRIEGRVTPVTAAEADAYHASRPRISRLGAWASDQSRPLESRAVLEARLAEADTRFPDDDIPRPPYWSGYRVWPSLFEFWQDQPFRLHDRLVLTPDGPGWRSHRLFP